MPALDQTLLHERLAATETDMHEFGWTAPDYLFGLAHRAPTTGGLGLELWMEMPGGAGAFLAALIDLKIRATPTIEGLVIITAGGHHGPEDLLGLPVLGQLRCSCEQAGIDPDELASRVAVGRPPIVRQRRSLRALLCVQRSGQTSVIVREGAGAPRPEARFPEDLGNHEVLRALALRVLGPQQ